MIISSVNLLSETQRSILVLNSSHMYSHGEKESTPSFSSKLLVFKGKITIVIMMRETDKLL